MSTRLRLSVLFFLQFAVWGCYLVSLGQYLGSCGLGRYIQWFYASAGFAALFMPAMGGMVADRLIPASRLCGLCHLASAAFMLLTWKLASETPNPTFLTLFVPFVLSTLAFSPTVALTNAMAFASMHADGLDITRTFPYIRVWGTVGFIAMMWLVNSLWIDDSGIGFTLDHSSAQAAMRAQYTHWQLFLAGIAGIAAGLWSLSLPCCPVVRGKPDAKGVRPRALLRVALSKGIVPLLAFSLFIGVALQINNAYVAPFLTHFRALPEYSSTFGAANATLLSSLSQISEALWILPVGFVMMRFGAKATIAASIGAWAVNFVCLGFGNTGSGLWLIFLAMTAYGVAFDFYNVAGAIYAEQNVAPGDRATAQGLLVMVNRGVASSLGMLLAGWFVNSQCHWQMSEGLRCLTGNWTTVWCVFAAYIAVVLAAFVILFPTQRPPARGRNT